MSQPKSKAREYSSETADGVAYTPHSMMHKAIVRMDPTKLEMIDGFERTDAGHKFVPADSSIKAVITGRDWNEKRVLVYGGKSTEEATQPIREIIERVRSVGHDAELVGDLEITNIAVSGELGMPLPLEKIATDLPTRGYDVEYEPEQFPAAIIKIDEPKATFLLFSTGRFVIQALRRFDDIEPAIETMQHAIAPFTDE